MRRLIALIGLAMIAPAQPQRIVSTAPSITEILFAVGAGGRVVGVSNYCHYPAEVNNRTRVGTYLKPNVEAILRLKPDLVIVQKLPNDLGAQLAALKIKAVEVDNGDMAKVRQSIRTIGETTGTAKRAAELNSSIEKELARIRQRFRNAPKPSVLFIVGRTPGRLDGLVAAGATSYLNELIDAAGGINAIQDSMANYPKIALETVVRLNPAVLIDMGDMAQTEGVTEEHKHAVVALWKARASLKAVQTDRVHAVASDIFVVPGPRMAEAVRAFAALIHPGAK